MRRPRLKGKTQTTLILHNYVLEAMDARAEADRLTRSAWLNQRLALRLLGNTPAESEPERAQ